jgi:hypothetical protein
VKSHPRSLVTLVLAVLALIMAVLVATKAEDRIHLPLTGQPEAILSLADFYHRLSVVQTDIIEDDRPLRHHREVARCGSRLGSHRQLNSPRRP